MAEKIGFLTFNYFDLPTANDFVAYKKLERRFEPKPRVKNLAETHPAIPRWNAESPLLDKNVGVPQHKFTSQLTPLMDEFHRHVLQVSRDREKVKRFMNRLRDDATAEFHYFRHAELLYLKINNLLAERVYRRVGRMHSIFAKVAQHDWQESQRFLLELRAVRYREAEIFPNLHKIDLKDPYEFNVKVPNELKPFDLDKKRLAKNRELRELSKDQKEQMRQLLRNELLMEFQQRQSQVFIDNRRFNDKRTQWHLHDVLLAFDKAWQHAWDNQASFRKLKRAAVLEQAEVYPQQFKKALRDPYEAEIRLPNQHNMPMDLQVHSEFLRANVDLTKLQIRNYRAIHEQRIDHNLGLTKNTNDQLNCQGDQRRLDDAIHHQTQKVAKGRGFILLAGSKVPQPILVINTDIKNPVPLALDLHGIPAHVEYSSPLPLNQMPHPEQRVWKAQSHAEYAAQEVYTSQALTNCASKTRMLQREAAATVYEDKIKTDIATANASWERKTLSLRQNLATMEYGEQKLKETIKHRPGVVSTPREPLESRPLPKIEAAVELRPLPASTKRST